MIEIFKLALNYFPEELREKMNKNIDCSMICFLNVLVLKDRKMDCFTVILVMLIVIKP